jgi:glycosyltransferase involved in cell wall biosynthesis
MKITVISSFFNRQDSVGRSLRSLQQQDCHDFKVVVVDDGSTDETYTRLKAFESDTIAVRRQANRGFVRTIIQLCEEADTEFIALLGAGDESLPRRLSAQLAFLEANPSVVAVGCGIENVDEITGKRWPIMPQSRLREGPITGGFGISHGEVMFRRAAYVRAGGYRALFPVGQASDLFRRLSRLGDFGYVEEILYRRYLAADGVNANVRMIAQREVLAAISTAAHKQAVGAGQPIGDDIDRYGMLYPFFAAPDRGLAIGLARAAIKIWLAGDRVLASRLARKSLGEAWTPAGLVARVVILFGAGALKSPMVKLMDRIFRAQGEQSLTYLQARESLGLSSSSVARSTPGEASRRRPPAERSGPQAPAKHPMR